VLRTRWLGRLPYKEAWDLQKAIWAGRVEDRADDYLLLLEHPPVYTIGRNGDGSNLLVAPEELDEAEVHFVDRGGDITYHGPGQLVGYPIMRLSDPKQIVPYVRKLEQALIETLADFGVAGWREEGLTGVWTEEGKVAAIGVRVSRQVTMHGFALNLDPEMSYFEKMNPCGITDRPVATLSALAGRRVSLEEAVRAFIPRFLEVF
jgi:lipoic acid synthetase/lipoyl(octanoyl) transferase